MAYACTCTSCFQVLGFNAPSFTYGTDLMLPVGANAELRAELQASPLSEEELNDISSVPQVGSVAFASLKLRSDL